VFLVSFRGKKIGIGTSYGVQPQKVQKPAGTFAVPLRVLSLEKVADSYWIVLEWVPLRLRKIS